MRCFRGALLSAAAALFLSVAGLGPAQADFKLHSPIVEEGELEFEHNGDVTYDPSPYKGGEKSFTDEIGYGVTSWWEPELEFETDHQAAPGEYMRPTYLTLENNFQLTEAGEYWADYGLFAEYGHTLRRDQASEITVGPMIQKEIGPTLHTVNIFFQKEVGPTQDPTAGTQLNLAWQSKWRLSELFEPGFEIYSSPGRVDHFSNFQNQELRAGPVIFGLLRIAGMGNLRYEAGYLPGLTRGTADNTIRWRLEWEIPLH